MHNPGCERHRLFFCEVTVRNFGVEGAPDFVSGLNRIRHRAGRPPRIATESKQFIRRDGMDAPTEEIP